MSRSKQLTKKALPFIVLGWLVVVGLWFLTVDGEAPEDYTQDYAVTDTAGEVDSTSDGKESDTREEAAEMAADEDAEYQTPQSLGDDVFARSLEGTDIDGHLRANAQGQLMVDLETRDFFDYFLNTVGEVAPEDALEQIEALARNHLPESAAEEALQLLDQYLDYKEQALELSNQALDPARQGDPDYQLSMLRGTFADLKQLRRQTLSPQAHDAFFGLEEAYGEYTLATMEIQQRDDLTPESRQILMDWHREQLPEVIRHTESRVQADAEMNTQRQRAIAESGSPQEAGEKLRKLGLPEEQAADVESYLNERAAFESAYADYQSRVDELRASGLDGDDLNKRKTELLEQHFEDEYTRTWARLESMGADAP